jgi:DNA polymerase-3 subunit delta
VAEAPRFYVFHGENAFAQGKTLGDLKRRLGDDPAMVSLNTMAFDGRTVSLAELEHACCTLPFLSNRRLVVVRGLIERLNEPGNRQDRDRILAFLPQLPASTRLILQEPHALPDGNPFVRLAASSPLGLARKFDLPDGRALVQWIRLQVASQGGCIEPDAIALLVLGIGNDLYLLENEIDKLLSYTRLTRPIRAADIRLLTASGVQAGVFDLVDAVGQRLESKATTLLRSLLEAGEEPLRLSGMITRQFRLLIQVRERLDMRFLPDEIGPDLGLKPYPTGKLVQQASSFTLKRLEDIYRRLLDNDLAIKTGNTQPIVALELLVVELCSR